MANSNSANPGSGSPSQNLGQGSGAGPNTKSATGPATSDKTGRSNNKSPQDLATLNRSHKAATDENLDFILDIPLEITVELGRTKMLINDLLKLGQGSVIELTKAAGDTLEILANQRLIAKGDVVVINDKYGIRLTEVVTPVERIERLG